MTIVDRFALVTLQLIYAPPVVDVAVGAVDVEVVAVVVVDDDGDTAAVVCWVQLHKIQPSVLHRLLLEDLKPVPLSLGAPVPPNPCAQGCLSTALKPGSSACSSRRWI